MTILYFIIALGLLVFIHEFGHFLMAKRQGIGVEKFSLGFGPKLLSFKRGETTYMLSALPLGGYVKLRGEDPEESDVNDAASYSARPGSHKFKVVFAGPFMNILLALILMPIAFMMGRSEQAFWRESPVVAEVMAESPAEKIGLQAGDRLLSIQGEATEDWKSVIEEVVLKANHEVEIAFQRGPESISRLVKVEQDPQTQVGFLGVEPHYFVGNESIVETVLSGGAAEAGGIQKGDQVIEIDGKPVKTWSEMADRIHESQGKPIALKVRREGVEKMVQIAPRYEPSVERWVIGIQRNLEGDGQGIVVRKYPFFEAVSLGFQENFKMTQLTFAVFGRLMTFQLSYKTIGGPIRIAQVSAAAARSGLSNFIYFLAMLSLQLGILNLLPIPALDGGHLLFMGIEKVIRRPVSTKVRLVADQAGFALLITLMVLVTIHDVESVWGFGKMLNSIKEIF